jgi:hypothetical protein
LTSSPVCLVLLAGLLGVVLVGCGPSSEELVLLRRETDPYRQGGSASITGQVTLETPYGKLIGPSDGEVFLSPVTTYTAKRFDEYVIQKNEVPKRIDAQLYYSTRTDANGRFKFNSLAAGDYLLATQVFWSPPGSTEGPQSALAHAQVRVGPGQTVETVVTRDVRTPVK